MKNVEFCDNCGNKILNDDNFERINDLKLNTREHFLLLIKKISKFKGNSSPKAIRLSFLILFLIGTFFIIYNFYQSYKQTQQAIIQTSKQLQETKTKLNDVSSSSLQTLQQLQETKTKLNDIASSTSEKLTNQEKELNQKTSQITKLEADLKNTINSNAASSNVVGDALSSLSPSIVKIICYSDAYRENIQMGSGVLYYSNSGDPSTYFIETNLHVVQTSDSSLSQCAIAVYPNYKNSISYLLYKTLGYTIYKNGIDFAYVIPQVTDSANAGAVSDLKKYAKIFNSNIYCKSTSIGDHVSILGYPSVGGSSLTATDGIISGFEYDSGSRFIKTSAKIEHGNSGGVAIKDSGCVLGIPTFVETGSVESIGRILDLNDLFNN